jgi:hypothetical protein
MFEIIHIVKNFRRTLKVYVLVNKLDKAIYIIIKNLISSHFNYNYTL